MKIILGLGNPGPMYAKSRHNIGILCVERFAKARKIDLTNRGKNAAWGEGRIDSEEFILAKSRTFVNLSGNAAGYLIRRVNSSPQDLVVVHDDLDLPLGKVRIRPRGSSGGHKGLTSIIQELGTEEFNRIRVGIGRPEEKGLDTVPYVLGTFTREEELTVKEVVSRVSEALQDLILKDMTWVMNRYNA
ncbi:MAG: aminoacyl-tRNA hydrolase [Chloroflexi bacterium]|nr:aminoacyl-tRNA hydrolase [Chloroflexota bacterium]